MKDENGDGRISPLEFAGSFAAIAIEQSYNAAEVQGRSVQEALEWLQFQMNKMVELYIQHEAKNVPGVSAHAPTEVIYYSRKARSTRLLLFFSAA